MKRLIALCIIVLMIFQLSLVTASAGEDEATPPIARGTINKVTNIYWGKGVMFPVLGLVGPGRELDVYEYDKTWVLVLYETYITVGYSLQAHSFYGYVKRTDITCDPELEGDKSPPANTGPGKRKGKKPKAKPPEQSDDSSDNPPDNTTAPTTSTAQETEPPEDDEELDWIIRTPGMCKITVSNSDGFVFKVSFALMAQKFGGYAASSDPIYNNNKRNPYAATAFFSVVADMQDMLESMGVSGLLSGSGGATIIAEAPGARFYIDTGSDDFALVNFTINMNATSTANPKVTGDTGGGDVTGEVSMTANSSISLPVQLTKSGSGYMFILKGMKPGGGDLEFPAVLEKAFHDPNREAKEADARRERAEELRKKVLKEMKEQTQKEWSENEDAGEGEKSSTEPLTVTGDNGEEIPLAPLLPSEEDPLAPLVPSEDDDLAPLVPSEDDDLAPLVPNEDENVNDFPDRTP